MIDSIHPIVQLKQELPSTPAFVLDRRSVRAGFRQLQALKDESGCKVLYSIKSLPLSVVLQWGKPYLDGFSVSSLFEARLADEILAGQGSLHLTTPGLQAAQMPDLSRLCQFISFNSLSQYRSLASHLDKRCSAGIRVNPKLSLAGDCRYDPCRRHSKLGAGLHELNRKSLPAAIEGIHFHTVFACKSFAPLLQTVQYIQDRLSELWPDLKWLNLGGGYLFNEIEDKSGFIRLVKRLRQELNLEIYIEPGNALINAAGYLVASVIDVFSSDGKDIAVLDTSVNHNPEVFEYQIRPQLCEHTDTGGHRTILAGCTCLAGDLFGEYRFKNRLRPGDRLVFSQVGAYSLVKANRFNGHNLPDIYSYETGRFDLLKQYTYQDYRNQWMV